MVQLIHLCPNNTLFTGKIERTAKSQGDEYFFYDTDFQFFSKIELISLFEIVKKYPHSRFLFHRTPSFSIFALRFLFPNLRYSVCYWGDDYYVPILSVDRLTRSCIGKSKFRHLLCNQTELERLLDESGKGLPVGLSLKQKLKKASMKWISARVASNAEYVYATLKQYRYLSLLGRKCRKGKKFPEQLLMTQYSRPDTESSGHEPSDVSVNISEKKDFTVLVCHSASQDVNVPHSLSLLEHCANQTGVEFNILGYLSYSGRDEEDRDAIEERYRRQADRFAKSVRFERRFLSEPELLQSFTEIDVAFFSSYRDEGVTLLSMLARAGKILCFNKLSINYDYFRQLGYRGLMSHDEFFDGCGAGAARDEQG